ncbi:unnamed protein product [Effrenium voratum]|nr:unnamed protein product [Effrenium voratum]
MGKLSSSGRPVDYTSKIAQRYKAQLDVEVKRLCDRFGVAGKAADRAQAKPVEEVKPEATPLDLTPPIAKAPAGYPEQVAPARGASAPAAVPSKPSVPSSHVVRKMEMSPAAPKPAGFAPGGKQMAKEIDFDFDFDDLETEAAKPKPKPAPKPDPKPAPAAPAPQEVFRAQSDPNSVNKFANKKGISSSDFFNEMEPESAQQRMDRESRFNKFSAAGAISSANYFGDGDEDIQNTEDMSSLASMAAGRGAEMARNSFAKGAEMLTEYLAKVRD